MKKPRAKVTRGTAATKPAASPEALAVRASTRLLFLPLVPTVALALFGLVPHIRSTPTLLWSVGGATALLTIWWAMLWMGGRPRNLAIALRPPHYMQTLTQASIFVYWGIYWLPIREAAPLIVAQIAFAYAFDMLLTWSRRDTYTLGFGPCPIILSINVFLRFHDEWFWLQFGLVAFAFVAKEFIRWNKDGRRVHIFNPSSFPLAIASVVLILTHATSMTWGEAMATQLFMPPQIFLFIFLVSLPGQFRFGITTMSLTAILTTYGFGLAYFAATGTYFFVDDYIPIAVFVGMLLLVTDPATAPRTELGRVIFGALYGLCTVGLYAGLGWMGAPTFYDKLLQIPVLNLCVQAIDRVARAPWLAWLDPARLGRSLRPMQRNLAYTSAWVVVFSGMTYAQGIGDHHPGHSVKFWQRACQDDRLNACRALGGIETGYCAEGSGWACNEAGVLMAEGRLTDNSHAAEAFKRACTLRFGPGCQNAALPTTGPGLRHGAPSNDDFALILREGKGPLPDTTPEQLLDRACRQGWADGCGRLGTAYASGRGVPQDWSRAAALFKQACDGGDAGSCSNLGLMYKRGDGVKQDDTRATELLQQACDLKMADACRWLAEQARPVVSQR